MIVWRLTRFPTLDGIGGMFASARWHTRGRRIIYTALSPAGALIEVLAGLDLELEEIPVGYRLLKIQISDAASIGAVDHLPPDWRSNETVTRATGDHWLNRETTACLRVPSAIIVETESILIAPQRLAAGQLLIAADAPFAFDPRLLHGAGAP